MAILTDQQLLALRKLVADHHLSLAYRIYGRNVISDADYQRLKAAGMVSDVHGDAARDAYLYGKVLQQMDTPEAARMTYPQLQAYLKQHPVPLSDAEERAIGVAAARGAQLIVGLGNTVDRDTGALAIEADGQLRAKLRHEIRDEVARGIAARKTVAEIKSAIGHRTGDWTRDLDRIAATETSRAMNDGLAEQIGARHGGEAEVAVRSRRGCCPQCLAAYNGPDGAPIIFKLTDLQANGTNYKKKRAEQLPVVPPYHPNCACVLIAVPRKWGFDAEGRMTPLGNLGLRPHAATTKSLRDALPTLRKGEATPVQHYYGLTLLDAAPAAVPGCAAATLQTPTTRLPALVGPHPLAPQAYVYHLPTGDHVVLGYHDEQLATLALAQHLPQTPVAGSAVSCAQVCDLAGRSPSPSSAEASQASSTDSSLDKAQVHTAQRGRVAQARLTLPVAPTAMTKPQVDQDLVHTLQDIGTLSRRRRVAPKPLTPAPPTPRRLAPLPDPTLAQALGEPPKGEPDINTPTRPKRRREPVRSLDRTLH